jgi:hypothetical protein
LDQRTRSLLPGSQKHNKILSFRADKSRMDEELNIIAIDKNFWSGKTSVKVGDMEKAHGDLVRFEDGVNRAVRAINRRVNQNLAAINTVAADVNLNIQTLETQMQTITEAVDDVQRRCFGGTVLGGSSLVSANHVTVVTDNPQNGDQNGQSMSQSSSSSHRPIFPSFDGTNAFPLSFNHRQDSTEEINTLTTVGQLEVFTEESVIAFDRWSERFKEYLVAMGRSWNDQEKLARLSLALGDTPRELYRELTAAQTQTVDTALKALRDKLDSPQRRELAKRTLSLCKQREGEPVAEFLRRLTPLVEVINSGLTDQQRKEKLCEELLDRISPKIGFLIKLVGVSRTKDFEVVKAQAQELEALLASEKSSIMPESVMQVVQVLGNTSSQGTPQQAVPAPPPPGWHPPTNDFRPNQQRTVRFNNDFPRYRNNNNSGQFRRNNNQQQNRFRANNQGSQRMNQQRRSERNWSARPICNFCNKAGHLAYQCRRRQNQFESNSNFIPVQQPRVNVIQPVAPSFDANEMFRMFSHLVMNQQGQQQQQQPGTSTSTQVMNSLSCEDTSLTADVREEPPAIEEVVQPADIPQVNEKPRVKASNWEGIGPKISRILMFLVIMLSLFTPICSSSSFLAPHHPVICQTHREGVLWALPEPRGCPRLDSFGESPVKQTLYLYSPNAFEHENQAWACRKIRKTVKKYTSISNVPEIEKLDPELMEVSEDECKSMIYEGKCSLGVLKNDSGIAHTDHKIDLSPRTWFVGSFNWAKVSSENCFLIPTQIYSKFGELGIHSTLGEASHCPYKEGKCILEDKTILIWIPKKYGNCEYSPMGAHEGHRMGNIWVADYLPILLEFDSSPKRLACGTKLAISKQGYAAFIRNTTGTGGRSKRATEGIVTDSQLQAELSFASEKTTEAMKFAFSSALKSICEYIDETRHWAFSAMAEDPTMFARVVFNNSQVHAKRVGPSIIKVWPCVQLERDEYSFTPLEETHHDKTECFEDVPIIVKSFSKETIAFLDPKTMIIKTETRKGPCAEFRLQIVQIEGKHFEYDQLTGNLTEVKIKVLEKFGESFPEMPSISSHSFHHLALNNVTDIISHSLMSNLLRVSEITYIHSGDTEFGAVPTKGWEDARDELLKRVVGDWTVVWRWAISIMVGLVFGDMLLRLFFLIREEYKGEGKLRRLMTREITSEIEKDGKSKSVNSERMVQYTPIRKIGLSRSISSDAITIRQADTPSLVCVLRGTAIGPRLHPLPLDRCRFNDVEVAMLIDTGSQISLAPKSLVTRISRISNEPITVDSVNLRMATIMRGQSLLRIDSKMRIRLTPAGRPQIFDVTVYLVDDEVIDFRGFDAIMGMDMIARMGGVTICPPGGANDSPGPSGEEGGSSSQWDGIVEDFQMASINSLSPNSSVIVAKINNIPINCLIDTGASVSVAPRSLISHFGCNVSPSSMEAMSASGHSLRFKEKGELFLEIGETKATITIHFVDDSKFSPSRDYQVLLGCDTFKRLPKMTFDYSTGKLLVGDVPIEMGIKNHRLAFDLRASATQNFTIPPDCQMVVEAQIESLVSLCQDVVVSTPDNSLTKANIGIISSVSTPLEGKIKLVLINPTNFPKIIYKGMHLAWLNEVSENEGILAEAQSPSISSVNVKEGVDNDPTFKLDFRILL